MRINQAVANNGSLTSDTTPSTEQHLLFAQFIAENITAQSSMEQSESSFQNEHQYSGEFLAEKKKPENPSSMLTDNEKENTLPENEINQLVTVPITSQQSVDVSINHSYDMLPTKIVRMSESDEAISSPNNSSTDFMAISNLYDTNEHSSTALKVNPIVPNVTSLQSKESLKIRTDIVATSKTSTFMTWNQKTNVATSATSDPTLSIETIESMTLLNKIDPSETTQNETRLSGIYESSIRLLEPAKQIDTISLPVVANSQIVSLPTTTVDSIIKISQSDEQVLVDKFMEATKILKQSGKTQEIMIKLLPDSLGTVEVKLSIKQDTVELQFKMDTTQTKTLLESATHKFQDILNKTDHSITPLNQVVPKIEAQSTVKELGNLTIQNQLNSGGSFQQQQRQTFSQKNKQSDSVSSLQAEFKIKEVTQEGNISILV